MYLLRMAGHQILIMGSMNYIEREVEGLRPDIAIIGANPNRHEIYDYTGRLKSTRPSGYGVSYTLAVLRRTGVEGFHDKERDGVRAGGEDDFAGKQCDHSQMLRAHSGWPAESAEIEKFANSDVASE